MRGRRGKITITVDQTRLEPGPEKVTTIDSDNTDCASQYIRLRISDNGVGIPPEILHRVQDPYFTTKPVGQGTGIGLWTVFGIVKNHDGQINIQSVPDQGTTTEILFPKANTVCWQQESQQEVAEPASARILVVDDEPAITDGLHRQLALAGHDVVSFNCGLEALQFLQRDSGRLDLLITDQIMPKISGDDLIREIKSLYPAIGTIVCSGYNPGPKIGSSFENLAHEEISKPFRFSQIALAIDRILNSSERTLKN
jgi:CheY-like chemotaxis protein